jgi:DNA-binding transcriptional ArsR family regulator
VEQPAGLGPPITIISKPSQLKAFAHPTRIRLLEMLIAQAMTTKQLGDAMGMSAARAHYHLKFLERAELVKQVFRREKAGIIEKYYRAVSRKFVVTRSVGGFAEPGAVILESLSGALLAGALAADTAPSNGGGDSLGLVYGASERVTLTQDQLAGLLEIATAMQGVQESFRRMGAAGAGDEGEGEGEGDDSPAQGRVYELTLAVYAGGGELPGAGYDLEHDLDGDQGDEPE